MPFFSKYYNAIKPNASWIPSFLTKVHKGRKAENMWQVSIAGTAFIAFVILPASIEYVMSRERSKYERRLQQSPKMDNSLREEIYRDQMALRKYLDEMKDDDDEQQQ
jgi:hypothetical protein